MVAELQLTAQQREQIRTIQDEALFSWMRGPRPTTSGSASRPAFGKEKSANERIVAVLTEEQLRRWRAMTGEAPKVPITPFPLHAPLAASGPKAPPR